MPYPNRQVLVPYELAYFMLAGAGKLAINSLSPYLSFNLFQTSDYTRGYNPNDGVSTHAQSQGDLYDQLSLMSQSDAFEHSNTYTDPVTHTVPDTDTVTDTIIHAIYHNENSTMHETNPFQVALPTYDDTSSENSDNDSNIFWDGVNFSNIFWDGVNWLFGDDPQGNGENSDANNSYYEYFSGPWSFRSKVILALGAASAALVVGGIAYRLLNGNINYQSSSNVVNLHFDGQSLKIDNGKVSLQPSKPNVPKENKVNVKDCAEPDLETGLISRGPSNPTTELSTNLTPETQPISASPATTKAFQVQPSFWTKPEGSNDAFASFELLQHAVNECLKEEPYQDEEQRLFFEDKQGILNDPNASPKAKERALVAFFNNLSALGDDLRNTFFEHIENDNDAMGYALKHLETNAELHARKARLLGNP